MSRLIKLFVLLASLTGLSVSGGNVYAAIKTSVAAGGNWGTAGTWSPSGVPAAGDTVTIAGPGGVTVDVTVTQTAAGSVTVNSGATLTATSGGTAATFGALTIASTGTYTTSRVLTVLGATNITGTINLSGARANIFTGDVTLNSGAVWNNTTTSTQTFSGNFTNNATTFTAGTAGYTFNGATKTLSGATVTAIPTVTFTGNYTNSGTLSSSTLLTITGAAIRLTNNGTITATTALSGTGGVTQGATGALNIGGTSGITTLTATAAGNTVNYTGGAQTAKVTTYDNLTLSGSGVKTFATTPTVNDVLSMEGTATVTVTAGVVTYGANATLQYNTATARTAGVDEWISPFAASGGVIIANTGAITMNSAEVFNAGIPLTINAGATLTPGANLLTLGGDFHNLGTFTSGSGGVTIAGTAATQSIDGFTTTGTVSLTKTSGTATLKGNVNGGAFTLNGSGGTLDLGAGLTHTFSGAWTRTAGALLGNSSTLNINGTTTNTGGTFTAGTSTVNYTGAAQTIANVTYNNLILSGSNAKTMGATIINGNFTMSGAATTAPTGALTVGGDFTIGAGTTFTAGTFNHTVSGNWSETGTYTPGTGTVTLNGAVVQTISGTSPVAFNNLTVTNATSPNITLASNVAVAATLTGTVTLTSTCPTDFTLTSISPNQVLHSCPTVVSSINRADANPTSAATVSWTVTFSRSVTGVDATAFSLVPTGLSGTFITAVTGSGTTWTVTANTGIGSGTLGLNQSGPGSVVPTLAGTFTGQVYTITATPALAEYRMDQANWNGTANEVVDSSGNGNHAQAFNSASTIGTTPAIASNPGTCRYGVFDNGGTITQGYVQTPLTDLTTDFTITAWIRTTDNTATGQRILIDDQNNTGGYGLSLADGTAGKLRFFSRGITPNILDSTYTIAINTWYFVAAVADITNKMRTIYVFDSAGTLLNSTTEAAWTAGAWGTDTGPVSIGGEVNGPPQTEPPATFHFKGNLDEVRVYQKVLSQNALASIATQTHACPVNVPDHLVIQSSGSGLTCAASTLTVVACQDATCATLFTGGVTGTFSATGTPTVNWDGTTGGTTGAGFVIPSGSSSVTKNVQVATVGSVVFGISSAAPAPTNPTTCNFGSPLCTFTASLAGFIFSDTTTGNNFTIPTQVAGVDTSTTLYLRAVQASTTNPAVCTPAIISQTTPVNMGYVCNNPAACQAGNLATITNTTTSAATAIAPAGTSVSLNFDANGSAPVTARYDDVGQITLNANKTVTPFGGATAVALNGSSNSFVVKPHHFDLSGIQQTAAPNLSNPAAADATGNKFVKAGEQFSVTVTAKNALGGTTKNYGQESSPESVMLTSTLVPGLGLTANPAIGGSFGAFVNGVASGTAFTWSEVGIITLKPGVADGSYLGAGDTTVTISGNVGRFYPDHFAITPSPITAACSTATAFTYLGQDGFTSAFSLTAQNTSNATTVNYAGNGTSASFAKLPLTAWGAAPASAGSPGYGFAVSIWAPSQPAGSSIAASATAPTATNGNTWSAGTTTVTAKHQIVRSTSVAAPTTATVTTLPVDSDGVTPTSAVTIGSTLLRYGRLRLQNVNGSQLLAMPLPIEAQYWNGIGFVTNTDDSCTTIANGNVGVGNRTAGVTTVSGGGTVAGGKRTLTLSVPAGNVPGAADVVINLGSTTTINSTNTCVTWTGTVPTPTGANMSYLLGNWCGANADRSPTARATFGIYKGADQFIYQRENF